MVHLYTAVELCAGAGGQALGLHWAGFEHVALVEIDQDACETLRANGRRWGWHERVHQVDLREWRPPHDFPAVQLVAAGVPCPPFSIAGRQLGPDDDRDLFPAVLRLVEMLGPTAIMIENVRGLLATKFNSYRAAILRRLAAMPGGGYVGEWRILEAHHFGVPQLRPRAVLVALRPRAWEHFTWPNPDEYPSAPSVGEVLLPSMQARGWEGATAWAAAADRIAPTLVGGSRKHGGPDLGPTRAKREWRRMGVDGHGLADDVPGPGFVGLPRLTVRQAALLQGFPSDWVVCGRKTSAYRQVGNAFPPPVAEAVGRQIAAALRATATEAA